MRNLFVTLLVVLTATVTSFAQTTYSCTVRRTPQSEETYYLDRRASEQRTEQPLSAGLLTRCGYAFNYDAVTYGASVYYQWSRLGGITAGFDGYYIPNKWFYRTLPNDTVSSNSFALPLWDIRAGFMLTRYFLFGFMLGKSNIGDACTLINMREDAWFVDNSDSNVLYGGFVTFALPVSKYFGFNIDFAVTNKTGFNIGLGLNATIPIR